MKIGTETASLVNAISATPSAVEPVVGMGATMLGWTDRRACTVTRLIPVGRTLIIEVTRDRATLVREEGAARQLPSDCQAYTYEADPRGSVSHYRRTTDGRWVKVAINGDTGRWVKVGGYLRLGVRDEFFDYSF